MDNKQNNQNGTMLNIWILEAKQGGTSFTNIYRYFFPKIFNFVFYRVGHKEKTEDLVAEIFMKVAKNFKTFSGNDNTLTAWIYTIARNQIYNFYREKNRKTQLVFAPDEAMEHIAIDTSAQDQLEYHFDIQCIRHAMNTLSEDEQEVLSLQFFEGLDRHQIASIIGIKSGAVATRVSRALQKLKQAIAKEAIQ